MCRKGGRQGAEGCVFLGTGVEQASWEAVSRQPSWLRFQNSQEMRLFAGRALMEDEKEMKPGWDTVGEFDH